MRRWAWLASLFGCAVGPTDDTDRLPEEPVSIAELWEGTAPTGNITLEDVVITSARSVTGTHAFAQAPQGGHKACLRIDIPTIVAGFPPPVGTPVRLTGTWFMGRSAPQVTVDRVEDYEVLGEPAEVVVTAYSSRDTLGGCLVAVEGLTVVSGVDPTGRADTAAGLVLGGTFGVTPGYGAEGDAVGILSESGVLAVRSEDDWTGELEGRPPQPVALAGVDEVGEGTWSRVEAVVQAAPWSRDGRWTVVQDAAGVGLWVDTEGWGLERDTVEGDVVDWVGEVRHEGGRRLRTWEAPTLVGTALPLETDDVVDAARLAVAVESVGEVEADGSRLAGGWRLDDRFVDLASLYPPATIIGIVREVGDDRRLAVVEWSSD